MDQKSNDVAQSETVTSNCLSCDKEMLGVFCHHCGKRRLHLPLTMRGLLIEAWDRVLQWESGLLRTIGLLLWRPKQVLQSFLAGQRLRYTHPITLMLFSATLSLVVTNSYGEAFWQEFRAQLIAFTGDSLAPQYHARYTDFYVWMMSAMPYWLLFVSLPIGALLRFAFPRRTITVAEAWVVSLYASAMAVLVDVVVTHILRQCNVALDKQMMTTNVLQLLFISWYSCVWLGLTLWNLIRIVFSVMLGFLLVSFVQSVAAGFWSAM